VGSQISPETARAVTALVQDEAAALLGYACTLPGVSLHDAEDLVQATFQTAAMDWERLLCHLDPESRRRRLFRVLKNKAIDTWRKVGSRQVPSEHLRCIPDKKHDPYRHTVSSIVLQHCWDRIAGMPMTRQKVAFLRWGEEWTSAEIADLLGISQATVRGHLKQARDELTEALGPKLTLIDSDDDMGEGVEW
jgi:RNA polymerase sigma factor (sigma-70 family)